MDDLDKLPKFMDGKIPDVTFVDNLETQSFLKDKVRMLLQPFSTNLLKHGFPGSLLVTMDHQNIRLLSTRSYMVSLKADGMRYLILINGKNEIYAFDRENNIFQLPIKFLKKNHLDQHISDTLIDVEIIMDTLPNNDGFRPRMLIFDIIIYEKNEIGKKDFKNRLEAIQNLLINPRNEAAAINGLLFDPSKEPMSVSAKKFWDISETYKLFQNNFQKFLGHHVDGLIFQPSDPYTPGQFNFLMKWKPPEESSIDFKFKIQKLHHSDETTGDEVGELYVHGFSEAFAVIKVTKTLQQFNGRIIECNFKDGEWHFMRERRDKSQPNSYSTAKSVMETIKNPLTEEFLINYIANNDCLEF